MSKRNGRKQDQYERLNQEGLLIVCGRESGGAVYGLTPTAEQRLGCARDATVTPSMLLLGYYKDSPQSFHTHHWEWIIECLTGLRMEQLAPFAPVYIFDVHNDKIVWQWVPEAITLGQ